MSMVQPSLVSAVRPSGVMKLFSVDSRRARGQAAVLVFDQPVQAEFRRAFHQRIGFGAQEFAVAARMRSAPTGARRTTARSSPSWPMWASPAVIAHRRRLPPEIHVVVRDPAVAAVIDFGGLRAVAAKACDQVEERLVAFGKIAGFRRPVVHLDVDVGGPVGTPRRTHQFVPDALQIGGLGAWARTGDQQIAAVLEIEGRQIGIRLAGECRQAFVGVQVRGRRLRQVRETRRNSF